MKPITKLNKELKEAQELLSDINQCIEKGWKSYLGDPIYKYRREVQSEVARIKREIRILSEVESSEPKKTKQTRNFNSPPDWWIDLYTDGFGNCFSDADPGL
jgi:hypothetical protein